MICPHCKTDIHRSGTYCSHCGGVIAEQTGIQHPRAHYSPAGSFTDHELSLLLEINRKAVSGDEVNVSVSQNDIDKLFG